MTVHTPLPERAYEPALREAVRLLDCLIGSADPDLRVFGARWRATLTEPVFDRLTVWLKAGPIDAPFTPDPLGAAQRTAARLLRAVIGCLERVEPAPRGGLRLVFEWDDDLHDRVMVWGTAVEDHEILGEDDEDGADREPPDYSLARLSTLIPGVPQEMAGLVRDLYAAEAAAPADYPDLTDAA